MKEGDRVICKSDNRHGVIRSISRYYEIDYYSVLLDGNRCDYILRRDNLKLESSLWQRVINKFKK